MVNIVMLGEEDYYNKDIDFKNTVRKFQIKFKVIKLN